MSRSNLVHKALPRNSSPGETPSEATKLEDASDLEEYKVFVAAFKAQREKMGYSQTDVVIQIRIRCGEHISECITFNFEQLQLHSITTVRGILKANS